MVYSDVFDLNEFEKGACLHVEDVPAWNLARVEFGRSFDMTGPAQSIIVDPKGYDDLLECYGGGDEEG